LQCEVEGDPEPRVYWMKDFVPIDMADQRFTILPQGRTQRVLKKHFSPTLKLTCRRAASFKSENINSLCG